MAARLDNPNRVGSGFINLGPMQRNAAASANWQTGSLGGSGGLAHAPAPPGVSDIWNNAPPQPPQPRVQAQPPQPIGVPPGMSARYGALDQAANLGLGFESLSMNSGSAPQRATPTYSGGLGGGPYSVGLGDVHGGLPPQSAAPQTASLMSLLHTPAPPATAGLSSAFSMGNGGQTSHGQTFTPQAPPAQLQNNGVHSAAFSSGAFAPPVAQQPPRQPAGPPRSLSSAADYAAAAHTYKPPVPARTSAIATVSVSRVPEALKLQAHQPTKEEWECPRCTFLNNIALRECEMCAFERVGRDEPQPIRSEEEGWHSAPTASARKLAPAAPNAALPGKSKAQSKNEKRRSKKRGDH